MGRGGRKWRWREVLPDPGCTCFGHKNQGGADTQWQIIGDVDNEEEERRGGISYDRKENHARYLRMLGDIKVSTRPELSSEHHSSAQGHYPYTRRRSSLVKEDLECLKNVETNHFKQRCSLRYSSLHRTKRKSRPIFKMIHDNTSILDSQYSGVAWCLLSTVGDWDFNIFNLDKLTSGRALFHVGLHLFQEHNLIEIFQLDIVKLMRCITLIEEGYHSANPYHNAVHAADVAQAMHCYLKENKVTHYMTPLEKMTAIMSALAHDLDHPGVNQAFLIATSNHLAALYNNTSVLENHHWRTAMGVFRESGVFDHFTQSMWHNIELQMKSLILATDITRQQEFLSKLKALIDNSELDMTTADHRHFMLQIALKCADICNPCRVWDISRKWSELVCDEFFKQGDYERKLHLPVTPLCDRQGTTVAKIQSGFMQFVVRPLFQEWYRFNPTGLSETMLENITSNKNAWDDITRQQEAQKAKEEQEKNTIPEENEDLNSSTSSNGSKSDTEDDGKNSDDNNEIADKNSHNQSAKNSFINSSSSSNKCENVASPTMDQHSLSSVSNASSPVKQLVVDNEKENSPIVPHPVGDHSHDEDSNSTCYGEDGEVDELEMPTFFLRRHSLPVSSPFNVTNLQNKETSAYSSNNPSVIYPNERRAGFPVGYHSARRHSLPTARIMPMTSFEKLSEKLSTLKETSPTDGRMVFDFVRWGKSVPRISLSSNVLMNVNLEATRLTDAHGLNQAMLSQQRRYQSEPQVTLFKSTHGGPKNPSMAPNSVTASTSLGKLQHSSTASNTSRLPLTSRDNDFSKTVASNNNNNSTTNVVHNNNNNSNSSLHNSSSSSSHHAAKTASNHVAMLSSLSNATARGNNSRTFHSVTVLPASTLNSNGPRRQSLNSSLVQPVSSVLVGNSTSKPRRASMDARPRRSSSKDIEAQPLLLNSSSSGDALYTEDSTPTNRQQQQNALPTATTTATSSYRPDRGNYSESPCYYNDTAELLSNAENNSSVSSPPSSTLNKTVSTQDASFAANTPNS